MSMKQLGGIKVLGFGGIAAPRVEDAQSLGRCLNLCSDLETLTFIGVGMSDGACAALFSTLASGAMAQLKELNLYDNQIGDEGMKSFSTAL
eukprot:2175859-Prymnesium_polylepis.1